MKNNCVEVCSTLNWSAMVVTFKRTRRLLREDRRERILKIFPAVDKSCAARPPPNLNVFSGLSGISMLIFCHTQSVIFVISETGGFYNGFHRRGGWYKVSQESEISFPWFFLMILEEMRYQYMLFYFAAYKQIKLFQWFKLDTTIIYIW